MTKFLKKIKKDKKRKALIINNLSSKDCIIGFHRPNISCPNEYRKNIEKRLKYPKKSSLYRQSDYEIMLRNYGILLSSGHSWIMPLDNIYTGEIYIISSNGITQNGINYVIGGLGE